MEKVSSRQFTKEDYLGYSGVVETEDHKPQISEFEDGLNGINLLLAYTVDDAVVVEVDVFQGDSKTSFIKSFDEWSEAESFFRELDKDLEAKDFSSFIDSITQYAFDSAF